MASHDGTGHSLHPGHPRFALRQPRWRLPWSAMAELVADSGQRDLGGRDVVAYDQICRVKILAVKRPTRREPCSTIMSSINAEHGRRSHSHDRNSLIGWMLAVCFIALIPTVGATQTAAV